MKKKPCRRPVFDVFFESVPRRTRGGRDRKLAAIIRRVAAKLKKGAR